MAKKSKTKAASAGEQDAVEEQNNGLFGTTAFDPALASLFSKSAGPLQAPVKDYKPKQILRKQSTNATEDAPDDSAEEDAEEQDDEELSELSSQDDEDEGSDADEDDAADDADSDDESAASSPAEQDALPERPRKRKGQGDELEAQYFQKLADDDDKAEIEDRAAKRQRVAINGTNGKELSPPPVHETLAPSKGEIETDKATRTVFLGNVSVEAITSKSAKHSLMAHLAAPLASLSKLGKKPHSIESIRFRSTAYAGSIPKKAAFALKDVMETTTKSTNAYVVYSTPAASRAAARALNGTVVLDRHLRADEVAHPMQVDHKRCVFVGNLGFVDDETAIKNAEAEKGIKGFSGKPQNGDVEEGLWRTFAKAGAVESVRVVRDAKTRVGKGFAYVQFADDVAIEKALQFHDKKFPPLLPRKLRVVRAKKPSYTNNARERRVENEKAQRNDKKAAQPDGRASKLYGRAGAANARQHPPKKPAFKSPESFVFEGQRASSAKGGAPFKTKKNAKKAHAKPANRSAKRGAAWKAKGKA